jgi:hypothetical protein
MNRVFIAAELNRKSKPMLHHVAMRFPNTQSPAGQLAPMPPKASITTYTYFLETCNDE